MPWTHKIKISRKTGLPIGYFSLEVENKIEEYGELLSDVFIYRKSFQSCFIDTMAFYLFVLNEMKKAILNDIPNDVAAMPLCPLEQMEEIETVDYC